MIHMGNETVFRASGAVSLIRLKRRLLYQKGRLAWSPGVEMDLCRRLNTRVLPDHPCHADEVQHR